MNDKIQRIIENQKIKNRLHEIGIYSGEVSLSGNIGPTGPKGEKGDKGDIGPTGERGPAPLASYDAIAFASFMNTTQATLANIGPARIIPGVNRIFSIKNATDIVISTTGVFEVTLCGRISGVTEDVGASFCLYNSTTNEIISDLNFKLDKGTTSDMDFCEVNVVDIYAPAVLNLKTVIDGTPTSDIKFTEMNVILKSYNV